MEKSNRSIMIEKRFRFNLWNYTYMRALHVFLLNFLTYNVLLHTLIAKNALFSYIYYSFCTNIRTSHTQSLTFFLFLSPLGNHFYIYSLDVCACICLFDFLWFPIINHVFFLLVYVLRYRFFFR